MKVLIIGLGSIGKKHISVIKSLDPSIEIYALRSKSTAEAHENVKNIFSYDEINLIQPDFAIVSNPSSEHKKALNKLINFRIPLFIEKPLYSSLDIEDLLREIRREGIITYVACNLRFLESIRFVKQHIEESKDKRLNEVNAYCGSYLPAWRPGSDYRTTYSAIPELGGGVQLDLIHELDYLYWFFDIPKRINRIFKNQSSLEISSTDYANYSLEYKGFCANVILNYYRRDPKRTLELVFDDETWNIDLLKNNITCNGKIIFSSNQKIVDTYNAQMKYFINCIKQGQIPFNTVDNAFDVLKICMKNDIKK